MDKEKVFSEENSIIEENRRLKRAVEELSALNEIATAITSTQPVEQIIDLIVKKCIKYLKVEQGAVMLLDESDLNNPFHTMIRRQDSGSNILPYRLNTQLTGWMLKNKIPLLTNNLETDKRFNLTFDKDLPVRSLLSVPLTVKGKMIGLLTVFNKNLSNGFTTGDQRLLSIIASQSAHVIENARLYREELSLLHLKEEMKLAYEIQTGLLPKYQPDLPGYQIAGKSISASEVGGDFYDFIELDSSRMAFCLGDVSGKGIPAALLMANLQAALRGQALTDNSCAECVSFANKLLYHNSAPDKFATLFYGVIDISTNQLTYCNAGHNIPLFLSKDNKITALDNGGMVIGVMPWVPYEEEKINFEPGDILVLFSDGIVEAIGSNEEEFGEERLVELVTINRSLAPEELIKLIIKEVKEFTGNTLQGDDMTLLIIKYTA